MQNMKKIAFSLLAFILCFSFFACAPDATVDGNTNDNGATGDGESSGTQNTEIRCVNDIEYFYLGTPLANRYTKGERARCALDLILYGGMLYAGSGDYDINLGPAAIPRYDIDLNAWYVDETVPDEEVNRFFVIDGRLVTPGIDPKEDWTLGNYYMLSKDGATWKKVRKIPNGIHTFDMVKYEGNIFVGCGVSSGGHPVRVSFDGGESFVPVEMRKDGASLDTTAYDTVRTYDFFVTENTLYATLLLTNLTPTELNPPTRRELYRYDAEAGVFTFAADLQGVYEYKRNTFVYVDAKASFDGAFYLTTGVLYDATTPASPVTIPFAEGETVSDLYLANDSLYALTYRLDSEGGYRIAVYVKKSAEAPFAECFNFRYSVPAVSLAVDHIDFYIGMGKTRASDEHNGDMLCVWYEE